MLQPISGAGFCIAVMLLASVYAQDPKVTIKNTAPATGSSNLIVAYRDLDLVMDCYVENLYDTALVRWQRHYIDQNDGLLKTQSISQDMALDDNIHYSIEKNTQYTWRLRVRGIQVTDEGKYICFVQLTQIARSQDFRDVVVVVIPYLDPQQTSPDTSVQQGDDLDLICNATGRPYPTILWSRLGGQLLSIGQEKYEGSLLHLLNIQSSDRGTYRCQAFNTVGSIVHDINLGVRFAPTITATTPVKQAVGYRVELQCFVAANPFPSRASAKWLHGATSYSMSSDGYMVNWIQGAFNQLTFELILLDVQQTDFGSYTCSVTNDYGTSTATIQLQESSTPTPSVKLGRVITGEEGAASLPPRGMFLLSIVAMLMAILLSY